MKRKNSEKVIALVLSMLMVFSMMPASVFAGSKEATRIAYVSIERYDSSTGTFELEPVQVEHGTGWDVDALSILNKAINENSDKTVSKGPCEDEIIGWGDHYIKTVLGITNDDANKWFATYNNNYSLSAYNNVGTSIKDGAVYRFMYSAKDGTLIGAVESNSKLRVNKDELVRQIALASEKYVNGHKVIDDAKACLVNAEATDAQVLEHVEALKKLLNESVVPDVQSVSINDKENLNVNIGNTLKLTTTNKPAEAVPELVWSVDNAEVASINAETGVLTGVAEGKVKVTVTVKDTEIKDTAVVNVKRIPAEGITINENTLKVEEGKVAKLTATITPSDSTDKAVWSSNNTDVATVNAETGEVSGISVGKAVIEAKAGDKTATIEVEVTETTDPYVYFQYKDGRKQMMDKSNSTFTLSTLDEGQFKIANYDGELYWDNGRDYKDHHGDNGTTYVAGDDGTYNPYGAYNKDQVNVVLIDKDEVLTFYVTTEASDIDQLRIKVNGKEYTTDNVFSVTGVTKATITVEGKKKGTDEYVTIPNNALIFESNSRSARVVNGILHLEGNAEITAMLEENYGVKASFGAAVGAVPVKDMQVNVPKEFVIDNWNHLGGYYVGIQPYSGYTIQFTPSNVTNKAVIWEALTPEIARHMDTFDNGIIPEKNGTAKFRVTSVDNPEVSKVVEIEMRYKKPLQNVSIDKKSYTLEVGNTFKPKFNFVPSDATEQRFHWNFESKNGGKIEIKTNVTGDIGYKNFSHEVTGVSEGTVKVTGTPYDTTNGVKPIEFTVKVVKGDQTPTTVVGLDESIGHGLKYLDITGHVKYGEEWGIITLARTGRDFSEREKAAYVESLDAAIASGKKFEVIESERIATALTAMGLDPRTVCKDHDFIADIYNREGLSTDHSKYTSNMLIWALTALDTYNYEIPAGAVNTRESLVKGLLDYQMENGGFNLYIGKDALLTDPMMDITGMALQALANYKDDPEVSDAIEGGLEYIRKGLTGNAGFINEGGENSCTSAQVIMALTKLDIDFLSPASGFVRNNKNIVNRIQEFKVDGGYSLLPGGQADGTSTLQVVYALEAFRRYEAGENAFYDMTDVKISEEKPVAPEVKPEVKPETGDVIIKDTTSSDVNVKPSVIRDAKADIVVELAGSKVVYDKEAVDSIKSQLPADTVDIKIEIKPANRYTENMTDAQNSALKKNKKGKLFKVTLIATNAAGKTTEIHNFGKGTATITVDYANPQNLKLEVVRVEEDGTFTRVKSSYADGKLTWVTNGHSYYMVAEAGTIKGTVTDEVLGNGGNANTNTNANGGNKAPKTGDSADVLGWMLLMLVAGAAVPAVRRKFNK